MRRDLTEMTALPPASQSDCGDRRANVKDHALDRAAQATLAVATSGISPASICLAWLDWALHLAVAPGKHMDLALHAIQSGPQDLVAPTVDPRFRAPVWDRWPFCAYRDAFLHVQEWWQDATTGILGVERHHEQMVSFLARQMIDPFSPSNFVLTNPVVLEAAIYSGGANFTAGARNWIDDVETFFARSRGEPARQSPYVPGRNVAVTPGKIVWRNSVCELLQYSPSTGRVAREPLFIVPSWIMKYYILDLQPHNSLIRYLVGEGYTVFAISWRNPGAEARDLTLNDYLSQGLLEALAEARARCGGEAVHAVGYCLGGTLLAIAAAALARAGRAGELRTVTLLAAQTDFTEPGELGLFIDASELAALDALMWKQGFLDGAQMAAAFQMLNARDLVWSRMMSEYLLGHRSKPNDLMAWNADTTRMPYRMHSEYLTQFFLHNDLAEGRYCVDGRPVALSDIEQPMFVVGTERDHVSPWRSVYKLHLLTHNLLTFVLTAGGHNAGIVSEPGHPGRHYRRATRVPGASYRSRHAFFEESAVQEGSWWPCWTQWLRDQSSGVVDARTIVEELGDAPGAYVLEP
ncbi:poly-beta-hydroxybutyrate polymerase domain-containing protein [Paraburkholderia hospita]|uniref:Poly-beta-hydroxybutyrate polymerase domain-containing protein n=1 Tax=Paraburkholderia hospita TaxID=169430 RepID=A0ABN0F5G9_9BURK|nr:alpha/beta fold hydrolase [Paraburkholderia hospita]EIM93835.1 poly-beta-hydroxybutyrate polymerase domain-containing protein [Paraburkholderia hospita]OUL80677.1 poly-beta-hydroxybutyrate polymerase [Paraburkholderia hospita]OUL96395.1 poly-beta-hydroxybutyrate polymerase [Paraburkholderia hospita]